MDAPPDLADYLDRIRQMQLDDRALMDKAARAFVSYIHSYSKHECNVLLRVKGTHNGCPSTLALYITGHHATAIHSDQCARP